ILRGAPAPTAGQADHRRGHGHAQPAAAASAEGWPVPNAHRAPRSWSGAGPVPLARPSPDGPHHLDGAPRTSVPGPQTFLRAPAPRGWLLRPSSWTRGDTASGHGWNRIPLPVTTVR